MCLIDEKAKGVITFHERNDPMGDLMTKTILTFGDSNTYGTPPMGNRDYHPRLAQRWPVVMAKALDCTLIEEGLGGRTACSLPANSTEAYLDGQIGLQIALRSHGPIDQLVIMLGTNDLQTRFGKTANMVAAGIAGLLATAHSAEMQDRHSGFETLVICPPPVIDSGTFDPEFMGAPAKSAELPTLYADLAARWNCGFLDAGQVIVSDPLDGVHFDQASHWALGKAVATALGS